MHPAIESIFVAFALREQPDLTPAEAQEAVQRAVSGRQNFNITILSAHATFDAIEAATKEVVAKR